MAVIIFVLLIRPVSRNVTCACYCGYCAVFHFLLKILFQPTPVAKNNQISFNHRTHSILASPYALANGEIGAVYIKRHPLC